MDAPKSYSIEDAARLVGVSPSMIRKQLAAGRLEARKCGTRTVILDAELSRYVASLPRAKHADPGGDAE